MQVYYHKNTGYVPVTETAYEMARDEGYYDEQPVADGGIKQLQLDGGEWTSGYRMGFYPQIRTVMEREFNRIFSDQVEVGEAFAIIETEGNELLERYGRTASN